MPSQKPVAAPRAHHEEASQETRRLTAPEIFHAVIDIARAELRRSPRKLAFSGLAGGITMGLSALGVAALRAQLGAGEWRDAIASLLYPTGFVAVIIGRAQLFTENTLYPVILVLDERKHFERTLRLWGIVFASNVLGALMFAMLAAKSPALNLNLLDQLVRIGTEAATGTASHFFWSGVIGGWLIALVAWTVTASHWTIGQLAMIYLLTFLVGVGHFSHCIAGSCEILTAVVAGQVPLLGYAQWLLFATLGNICGGVMIVSLLNYGQVREI
jgi:formate/nitrite transporter FocA (FNT family)